MSSPPPLSMTPSEGHSPISQQDTYSVSKNSDRHNNNNSLGPISVLPSSSLNQPGTKRPRQDTKGSSGPTTPLGTANTLTNPFMNHNTTNNNGGATTPVPYYETLSPQPPYQHYYQQQQQQPPPPQQQQQQSFVKAEPDVAGRPRFIPSPRGSRLFQDTVQQQQQQQQDPPGMPTTTTTFDRGQLQHNMLPPPPSSPDDMKYGRGGGGYRPIQGETGPQLIKVEEGMTGGFGPGPTGWM